MLSLLYRAAAGWTVFGLASGLFYREFTKLNDSPGGTQLAVVHTHALTLGTMMMLILLALVAAFGDRLGTAFRTGLIVYQAGLGLTVAGLTVKGCLQVLQSTAADSPAIAGVSGLGHMTLTVAFLLLFLGLRPAIQPSHT